MRWILLPAFIVSSGLVGSPIVPGHSKGVDAGEVLIGSFNARLVMRIQRQVV